VLLQASFVVVQHQGWEAFVDAVGLRKPETTFGLKKIDFMLSNINQNCDMFSKSSLKGNI
jgi:hypothetical protein